MEFRTAIPAWLKLCIIVAIRDPADSGRASDCAAWGCALMSAPLPSSPATISGRPMQGASKEFALLCACAAVNPTTESITQIAGAAECGVDWEELFQRAEHHGILPLVARNLNQHTRTLPAGIHQRLQSAYEQNVRRNLWFASELGRIAVHLAGKHLQAVPHKGPVLAQLVYGDVALRSFNDLDFLISPSDFEQIKQSLAELGYRPSAELRAADERFWLAKGYERSFDGVAGKNLVELQWGVLPYFYAVELPVGELLARAGRFSLGACEVSCLSANGALVSLCLHAAKHLWKRLIWLCDIAETLRSQTIDYPLVFAQAQSAGILRIVGVSFWLAEQMLGTEIPEPARQFITSDPQVPVLGQEFAARLSTDVTYDLDSSEYFRLFLRLRERPGDRRRYLWRLISTPGAGDLAAVPLPEVLFPFYRVVRIARLLRKLPRM